jgi:SAM-dependent methyltransferase
VNTFFQQEYESLVVSPNGSPIWWHSMPLPDGRRISGFHDDKDVQLKLWRALRITDGGGLTGKTVLDIGANDGFFTVAALMAGAREVTAIDCDWEGWPDNIRYAGDAWGVEPQIVTGDFLAYDFQRSFDVILLLGVLYHLDNVFQCMRTLRALLEDDGVIYLETQTSQIQSELPIFEYASDSYPTIARQHKEALDRVGISNYLFPNEHAVRNLACSYDLDCEVLGGPNVRYTADNPSRGVFRLTKARRL